MKIVYMGTPDFAVAPLEALLEAGYEVSAVVTQPDKPKGRGKALQMSPVKECALRHGLAVFQPVKIREASAVSRLAEFEADLFVVAAFGQILSEEILNMPRLGCINIHASLLPSYRGAAPIQWAVLNGEKESGVTIMRMAKGVDTGDMFCKAVVPLEEKETGGSLHDKLMEAGAKLLVEALPKIERGELLPVAQKEEEATHAGKLFKTMGLIDWRKDSDEIERLVRGLDPWPSAYTFYKGKQLKIWEADVMKASEKGTGGEASSVEKGALEPGTVAFVGKDFFDVVTGKGMLRVKSLQIEGKRRMQTREFLLGNEMAAGLKFE